METSREEPPIEEPHIEELHIEEEVEEVYDPFKHRQVEHPTSVITSIIQLIKACLGTGLLAMPAAFKNSGYIAGFIGAIIGAVIVTHAVAILVSTAREACVIARKPSMSFSETCEAAFIYGPQRIQRWAYCMKLTVDISLVLIYVSVLVVYVVFIATTLKQFVEVYSPELGFSIQLYCSMLLIPLMLICQIRNLKFLMPINIVANVGVCLVIIITSYYIFSDVEHMSFSDRDAVASVSTWPLFFSTLLFALIAIGIMMPIENEMADPEKFLGCPGVLYISMSIVSTLYGIFGFCGYMRYGDDCKGSITLNLPLEETLAQSTNVVMAIVILLSYTTMFYIPMEVINRKLVKKRWSTNTYANIIQIGTRCLIVGLSVAIAALIPNLELVISLFGSVFFSTLGLFLPALVQILFRWDRDLGRFRYILWKNCFIGLCAIVALIAGAYTSIKEMIEFFSPDPVIVID